MSFPARRKERGFTLIELLIVVIILAILAAIAIPQFSASTVDARNAALDANLSTIRSAIEQYRIQHNNVYPAVATAVPAAACPGGGVAGTGGVGSPAALISQLTMFSNAAGQTCSIGDTTYRFGPYMRQGIPNEPINNLGSAPANIAVVAAAAPIVPAAAAGGWTFSTASGQFIMNSNADDGTGRLYSAH